MCLPKCSRCNMSFVNDLFNEVEASSVCLFCDPRQATLQEVSELRKQILDERMIREALQFKIISLKEKVCSSPITQTSSISNSCISKVSPAGTILPDKPKTTISSVATISYHPHLFKYIKGCKLKDSILSACMWPKLLNN